MSTVDIDWLDPILEQYWKQRHGMYNANQDDVEMAHQEAKEAIANKIVELVLKDRTTLKAELLAKNTDFIQWLYMRDFGETLTTERLERAYKEYGKI